MSRSRAKGTAWESEIVRTLVDGGWPHVERRALHGSLDKGDIAGIPGIVVEAKNAKTISLASWLDEANEERDNAGAEHGFVWIKRRGRTAAGAGYAVMDGDTLMALLKAAGY